MILKKYKGPINKNIFERIVNNFLKKHLDAEIRSRDQFGLSYDILLGDEGMSFGLDNDSPSTLYFHSKNPTQLSLDLIKEFSDKLNLNIRVRIAGSETPIKKEDLKLKHLNT